MSSPKEPPRRRRRRSRLERAWPWVLRFSGLAIGLWSTVVDRLDRPSALMFALALLGIDGFVHLERGSED